MRKGIGHEIGEKKVPDHTKTAPRGVKMPQDAPRPRSWSQLGPKRGPKIDPKSIKIRAWEPPRPKTPQDPPQGKENDTKIKEKTINFDGDDMQTKAYLRRQNYWSQAGCHMDAPPRGIEKVKILSQYQGPVAAEGEALTIGQREVALPLGLK